MADNTGRQARLYLPGSEAKWLSRASIQKRPDRGADDRGGYARRNRAVRAAGKSQRNPSRGASGKRRQKRNLGSAFVPVRIIQLLAVLAAIVVFYVAYRLGWL